MAQVILVDSDSHRGRFLNKVLLRKGYNSRFLKSKGEVSREIDGEWGWADIVFLAGIAIDDSGDRSNIFRVVYPSPCSPMISTRDTKFFLQLTNQLVRKHYTWLPFDVSDAT